MFQLFRANLDALVGISVRAGGVAAGFGIVFYLGHFLGPEANGEYGIINQTALFMSTLAVGGLDLAITKEFSKARTLGAAISRKSFFKVLLQAFLLAGSLILLIVIFGDEFLYLVGKGSIPVEATTVLAIILLSRTITRITGSLLRSQGLYAFGQSIDVLFIPILSLFLIFVGLGNSTKQVLMVTAACGIFVAITGLAVSWQFTSASPGALEVSSRQLIRTGLPLWGVTVALNLGDWYGLAVVSTILGVKDAGLYRVALQIGTTLSLVSMGLMNVYAPQFSAAHHASDRAKLAQLGQTATKIAGICLLPLGGVMFLGAPMLLRFVGPEFVTATAATRVVLLGQVVIATFQSANIMLAMTGHGRINLVISAVSTISIVIFAPLSVAYFGIVGAAVCTAASAITTTIICYWFVRKLERVDVLRGAVI
jgi:O-antigen/teichoic acid export membrane protein